MRTRILKNKRGFSLIETMIAGAITSLVVYGGATVMGTTVKSEMKSNVQALIDTEFAQGTQLAANAARLAEYVNPGNLGACLTKDGNSNCASFSAAGWVDYPSATGPNKPIFQTSLNTKSTCNAADANCMVARRMRYRWLCTARECSGLETEVRVTPLQRFASDYRERVTTVKVDRRQFFSRAQLQFYCDSAGQTMKSVDYNQLRDVCASLAQSNCGAQATYNPANPANDCKNPLASSCFDYGYRAGGLDATNVACREAPPPTVRSPAAESTSGISYAPDLVTQTATNTVVAVVTTTTTATSTVTAAPTATATSTTTSTTTSTDPSCPVETFTSDENGNTFPKGGIYWCTPYGPEWPSCDPNRMPHKAWVLFTDSCMLQCQNGKIRVVKNGPYPGGGNIGNAPPCDGPESNKKDPLY